MGDSLSFSSILSRYTASPAAPAASAPTSSTQPSRASSASTNGVKPAQKLVSRPPTTTSLQTGSAPPRTSASPASLASTTRPSNSTSSNIFTQDVKPRPRDTEVQAAKRRKLEQQAKPVVMTPQEKEMEERKKKLLEIKQKKQAAAAAAAEAARPKVASYKELLAEAAKYHEEKPISQIGVIKHKASAPIPVAKKRGTAIKGGKDVAPVRDRKSKSPATAAASDKIIKKVGDSGKAAPLRKTGDAARPTSSKPADRTMDRKKSADLSSVKRKRDDSAADSRKKSYSSAPRRSRYDDDEEDDWIVDDDEDDPRGGSYGGYGGGSRYRYADYSDEDDSDMEAAGIDILEEEDRSRIAAIREDQREAKRLEEEAKRKAALKKAAGGGGRLKK